ncbi:hypothetical protein ACWT_0508 [Actinoplanes sp. SE50]|uniref:hypothetical protein n=1 Tax=unclassified Actinoplanes TaxID=2626549 RepID=UPI00023ECA75|nr:MULTISPECIES: hypothetical protein [unclassified Actinoplanes]AEV81521.1 hypothetical protein ACPL_624 [Actinoplanes sp. SE50/110]ATO79923.1 hypothetical protein ACWT_0508 [Actinoplanes sp. SE50]SLL97325.1 hypothetical protein ACSP50_0526 [Actinoplanes sp. SE50/110]
MRVISRWADGGVEVFDESLEPCRSFPVPPEVEGWAVPASRDSLIHAIGNTVIRIGPGAEERWRCDLSLRERPTAWPSAVTLSADETRIWVYAPGREDGHDAWFVLDAGTGREIRRYRLPTGGQRGQQFPVRDGSMLLSVSRGQDGWATYRAGPDGTVHDYAWDDRALVDLSPDQRQFMTVDHWQEDVAFHDFADGAVRFRIGAEAFGLDRPDVEYAGGYLDDETAIVVAVADDDSWRHFRVGARTGEVLGDLGIMTIDEYDLQPLGDGTYVITDTDGTLRRM